MPRKEDQHVTISRTTHSIRGSTRILPPCTKTYYVLNEAGAGALQQQGFSDVQAGDRLVYRPELARVNSRTIPAIWMAVEKTVGQKVSTGMQILISADWFESAEKSEE